jgi:2-hydroxy-3-keto-5-methylthiopentenyl-1-phosphate phosphatase|tara:strand:+ start:4292 stop:4588 length:297 start_codon:yes stop_codon:yes gene_type:complete
MSNEDQEGLKKFKDVVKLMIILQSALEQMDEIKGIHHLYRHDIKKSINNTEKKIEAYIKPLLKSIPKEQESMFMQISRGVDQILEKTLEEIHNKNIEN